MRFTKVFLALALLASPAAWATAPAALYPSSNVIGSYGVPAFGIYCMDANNNATVCAFGGGSGSGGAVTQSTGSSSTPWWMEGLGTAGSPAGGVLTIQGITGGQAVPTLDAQSGTWTVGLSAGTNAIGSVTVSNFPATQPVSATSLPLPAGAATAANQMAVQAPVAPGTATATQSVLLGCLYNTSPPAFTAGQQGAIPCDAAGRIYADIATNVPAYLQAVTSGGVTTGANTWINAASSAMATAAKTSGGNLYGFQVANNTGAAVFFRLFNLSTAPTVGTSTPEKTVLVPAGATYTMSNDVGLYFGTGIAFDVTTGSLAASDTTTITTASTVVVNIDYK